MRQGTLDPEAVEGIDAAALRHALPDIDSDGLESAVAVALDVTGAIRRQTKRYRSWPSLGTALLAVVQSIDATIGAIPPDAGNTG